LTGLTASGRATVEVLPINLPDLILLRAMSRQEGRGPRD
jgi:hypothetical protein